MRSWARRPVLIPVLLGLLLAASAGLGGQGRVWAQVPTQGYEVVRTYPHDRDAFTQGLFFHDGRLFETTGRYPSTLREVTLETGQVLRRRDLPTVYFGEGATALGDKIYSLTWRNQIGFVWGLDDFKPLGGFTYAGEGWALATDGRRLIMSDGTAQLRFLDPTTLAETGRITVTADGVPVEKLNELEWVNGELLANIWQDDRIARIDTETGAVKAFIDLSALVPDDPALDPADDVLNGIAWDADSGRLFVTGKMWPNLFEIRLKPLP